jgi:hypothetical protein
MLTAAQARPRRAPKDVERFVPAQINDEPQLSGAGAERTLTAAQARPRRAPKDVDCFIPAAQTSEEHNATWQPLSRHMGPTGAPTGRAGQFAVGHTMAGVDGREWLVVAVGSKVMWQPLYGEPVARRGKKRAQPTLAAPPARRKPRVAAAAAAADVAADEAADDEAEEAEEAADAHANRSAPAWINRPPPSAYFVPFGDAQRQIDAGARQRQRQSQPQPPGVAADDRSDDGDDGDDGEGGEPVCVVALVPPNADDADATRPPTLVVRCRDGRKRQADRAELLATPALQQMLADFYEARFRVSE